MAGAGLVGGILSYFLSLSDEKSRSWIDLGRNVLLGIVASFLIPLFLNTISSSLVTNLLNGKEGSPGDMLVFFGFCLLAAIFSRKFISSLSEKLLREVSEAKEEAKAASEAVENTIVEPESDTDATTSSIERTDRLSPDEQLVLNAMQHSRYQLRSAAGLARDIGRDADVTHGILSALSQKGCVAKIVRTRGDRWTLTKLGQNARVIVPSDSVKDNM